MLYVTINGSEKSILFKHTKREKTIKHKDGTKSKQLTPTGTTCVIANTSNRKVIGKGKVSCHHKDRFEYSRGRKLALASALAATDLSVGERKIVWDAYLARN